MQVRMSDAMRRGAAKRPQAFGTVVDPATGGTCAWGAAMDGVDRLQFVNGVYIASGEQVRRRYGWQIVERMATCPACNRRQSNVGEIIVHLNDQHRWTREAIADWLDVIDPPPAPVEKVQEPEEELVGV
jgi:hypothetical protein